MHCNFIILLFYYCMVAFLWMLRLISMAITVDKQFSWNRELFLRHKHIEQRVHTVYWQRYDHPPVPDWLFLTGSVAFLQIAIVVWEEVEELYLFFQITCFQLYDYNIVTVLTKYAFIHNKELHWLGNLLTPQRLQSGWRMSCLS